MARIELDDGTEVLTPEPERMPLGERARRNGPMFARRTKETGRQRVERGVKTIFRKGIEYVTGEGDDTDRALRMMGLKEEPPISPPFDPDFD